MTLRHAFFFETSYLSKKNFNSTPPPTCFHNWDRVLKWLTRFSSNRKSLICYPYRHRQSNQKSHSLVDESLVLSAASRTSRQVLWWQSSVYPLQLLRPKYMLLSGLFLEKLFSRRTFRCNFGYTKLGTYRRRSGYSMYDNYCYLGTI